MSFVNVDRPSALGQRRCSTSSDELSCRSPDQGIGAELSARELALDPSEQGA